MRCQVAGRFEIFKDNNPDAPYSFQLTAEDGTVVAVSRRFPHLKSVVAGIIAVRENAATGFVVDRTGGAAGAA
ncbi:DUF1508 domain-containing protein [Paenarthrobacter sp. DKR-5]|uniref:YegP family protein n=1 Tax=Paenarthrobacter sp. DKR-5 TaxID=2835535 RepID=UPI001BDDB477|nr:DUF1508 domain-containing protein [Paenarthrobacter sp. DKR-5]MBT1001593.1 DUF1508 domain-containing protein [Paenarthrobacter sp. DKR-5]